MLDASGYSNAGGPRAVPPDRMNIDTHLSGPCGRERHSAGIRTTRKPMSSRR